MTLPEFRAIYPEFDVASDELVQSFLDQQALRVSDSWEDSSDLVHGLRTAHALSHHPTSRGARLTSKEGDTLYSAQLKELEAAHAFALNRIA
jgi:hypothetical protein